MDQVRTISLALAVASAVLAALADCLYKRAQLAGTRPTTFLWVQSSTFNLVNISVALISQSLPPDRRLLIFGPLLGVTMYTSRLLFLRSLRQGDLSVNAPIFRLSFVVTAALAIGVSGELLYPAKLVGMAMAVLAVFALLEPQPGARRLEVGGAGVLLAATLSFGLFGWFQKLGTSAGLSPPALLVAQGLTYLALALPGSMMTGNLRPRFTELLYAPLCGVLLSTSFLALLFSLQTGEASVNIPISQLSFVLSAILAAPMFGERLTRRKLLGLLAAMLAVVVFGYRGSL